MEAKTMVKLSEQISKATKLGEMDRIVKSIKGEELIEIESALNLTKEIFGIDMRTECYLRCIQHRIEDILSASSYEFTGGNTGADFNTEEEVA